MEEPVTRIEIPERALRLHAESQRNVATALNTANSVIQAITSSLGVPDGWVLEQGGRAFVPPTKKEPSGEGDGD